MFYCCINHRPVVEFNLASYFKKSKFDCFLTNVTNNKESLICYKLYKINIFIWPLVLVRFEQNI